MTAPTDLCPTPAHRPARRARTGPVLTRALAVCIVVCLAACIAVAAGPWSTPAATAAPAEPAAPTAPAAGPAARFTWPLAPPVTVLRRFAPPPYPWLPGHRGVDLAAATGRVVRSAGAGTVVHAGPVAGKPVVVVSHGLLRTTYEPVHPLVTVGQSVGRAQWIGTVAASGGHCGGAAGCLHWGLIRGGTYLDPLLLLAPSRVVLKPP